jgi:chemotaxis protein MotA
MDKRTILGMTVLAGLTAWIVFAGTGTSAGVFWQTPSIAFVVGGSAIAALLGAPGMGLRRFFAVLRNALAAPAASPRQTIIRIIALAEIARRDGLLAMDRPAGELQDGFLRRALEMVIDGIDREAITQSMRAELECIDLRHAEGKAVLDAMARFAPAFGMMGTLVGLVSMLGRMDDPARIGPGMAVALLTTLYGLILANLFCLPLSRRLALRSSHELLAKTIALQGALGIQAGDNPRVLSNRLRGYLPAADGDDLRAAGLGREAADRPEPAVSPSPSPETSAIPVRSGLDDGNARKIAEQLEKMIGRQKRLVDAA